MCSLSAVLILFCCFSGVCMFFKSRREYFTARSYQKLNENHTITKTHFSTDSPHNIEKRQEITDAHRTDKNANIVVLVR